MCGGHLPDQESNFCKYTACIHFRKNSNLRYRRLALQPKARVIGFLLSPLGGIIADDGSAHSVTRGIEMGDATEFVNMVRGEFGR